MAKENEPRRLTRRHSQSGMTDRRLEVKPRPVIIEGTPLAQSRFDRMMAEADTEIGKWRKFIDEEK